MRVALLLALCAALASCSADDTTSRKVYVALGMHGNFYHSWRGDTPDEAGFGTDIRVVREILRILDDANERGLDARAYWDTDNLFTLEEILPAHAPDILSGIRRRVLAGHDEIVLAPYNNGLFSAMTADEVRASLRWAIRNPWGSGAEDLFDRFTPIVRPQEGMVTPGLIRILEEEGIDGMVLAYSGYPFTTFSAFVPTLPPEQRYNATWLRLRPDGPRTILLPCVSVGDVLNHVSLEAWLLELRELQTSGAVDHDLLLHVNFDSDADSWLPQDMPPGLGWFPNAGGLVEYIEAVNAHDWAEFTTLKAYLAEHDPVGEVVVRQDLADGAFDGQFSWAEKQPSHAIWSDVAKSRLADRRARALFGLAPDDAVAEARALLVEGRESSFFERLRALSTTHFGMSTPLVNEERQAVAKRIAAASRAQAERAERALAEAVVGADADSRPDAIYSFLVRDVRRSGDPEALHLLRLPLLLRAVAPTAPELLLLDDRDAFVAHSLVNVERLGDRLSADLMAMVRLRPGEVRRLHLYPARRGETSSERARELRTLENRRIRLDLDATHGIRALRFESWKVGGEGFVAPFLTYRGGEGPVVHRAEGWRFEPLAAERWDGVARARMRTRIPFETSSGGVAAEVSVDLTLPYEAEWILADVEVAYPYTEKRDLLPNIQQKLRRPLDLRWIEVGPFPLRPELAGTRERPLTVWKHNFLEETTSYELDYGRINPANAELDAFNHQVTAGWVAATDRDYGLLVGYTAEALASHAFAPMRLREVEGAQRLTLNPFGSYHGRQPSHDHLGGTGLGTEYTLLLSASLRPNGPSYNGARERFSLLLGPYAGDEPPPRLRADADVFFQPPAVVYLRSPDDDRVPEDVRLARRELRLGAARDRGGPLPAPRAFLVNATGGAADLVWDPPEDPRVEGYEIEWRRLSGNGAAGKPWKSARIGPARRHRLDGLADGDDYAFRVRAVSARKRSEWTPPLEANIGPVPMVPAASALENASWSLLLRTFYYGLVHWFRTL